MKRGVLAAALAVCLLCGCTALLERSYSSVEPYADRYWDSSAEDTLRVDNYQDLVSALLMLVEQRSEEAVIRCSEEASSYQDALSARNEVLRETSLGSYLLEDIRFSYESGTNYGTTTFLMTYRRDTEDPNSLMPLSDSQSLVDLLRLTIREEHEKLTARFTNDITRETVTAAVEDFWQELCRDEMQAEQEAALAAMGSEPLPEDTGGEEASPPEEEPDTEPEPEEDVPPPEEEPAKGEEPGEETEPASGVEEIIYPPCPWEIHFYPNRALVEIVEVVVKK